MPVHAYLLPLSIVMTVFDFLMFDYDVKTVKTEPVFASSHFVVHPAFHTLLHCANSGLDLLIFAAALSHIRKQQLRFTAVSFSCVFA